MNRIDYHDLPENVLNAINEAGKEKIFRLMKFYYIQKETLDNGEFDTIGCDDCGDNDSGIFVKIPDSRIFCIDCAVNNLEKCENCDSLIYTSDDDIVEHEGHHYCQSCFDENFNYCEDCGEYHDSNDFVEIHTEAGSENFFVCERCAHTYSRCDDCGNYFITDQGLHDDYHSYCPDCMDEYYACNECRCIIHRDNIYADDNGYSVYCESCYEERKPKYIHSYSYKPSPRFNGLNSEIFYGMELEIDQGDNKTECAKKLYDIGDDENLFYLKEDGSLDDGIEIVSHPMTLQFLTDHKDMLGEIRKTAREFGFLAHEAKTCGLHFHISRESIKLKSNNQIDYTIAKILFIMEKYSREFLKFSRRDLASLNRWAANYGIMTKEDAEAIVKQGKEGSLTRYKALNLCPSRTIEFRLFRSSLLPDTILATLEFVDNVVWYAIDHNFNDIENSDFLAIAEYRKYAELSAYLIKRSLKGGE